MLGYSYSCCLSIQQFAYDFVFYFLLLGVCLIWTFVEYREHRFRLHAEAYLDPEGPADGEHLAKIFQGHLAHHVFMNQQYRIALSFKAYARFIVPATVIIWFFVPHHAGFAVLSGFITGSLIYDYLHLAFHGLAPELNFVWFQYMKSQHMRHHFRDNSVEFGVTTDLWDHVIGSKPTKMKAI